MRPVNNLLLNNSLIYVLGGLLPQALNFFLIPLYSRYLSPEEFGIFSYITAISIVLFILGSLTLHSFVIKQYYHCQSEQERRDLLGSVFAFLALYNVILILCCYIGLPVLFQRLEIPFPFHPYMSLLLLSTFIEVLAIIPLVYYRVKEQAGKYIFLTSACLLINAVLSIVLVVVFKMGVLGRLYGQLAANLVMLLVYLAIMSKISHITINRSFIRKALVFSLPLVPAQFLLTFGTVADRFVIERFLPISQLGIYSVAFSIAFGIGAVTRGIFRAVEPQIFRYASEGKLDEKILNFKKVFIVLLAFFGMLLITFSQEIVLVMVGPEFRSCIHIIPYLLTAVILQGITNIYSLYLMASHRTGYESIVRFSSVVLGLVCLASLLPKFQLIGAGISIVISSLAALYGFKFAAAKVTNLNWSLEKDLLMMLGLLFIGVFLLKYPYQNPAISLISKLIISVVVFLILNKKFSFFEAWGRKEPVYSEAN